MIGREREEAESGIDPALSALAEIEATVLAEAGDRIEGPCSASGRRDRARALHPDGRHRLSLRLIGAQSYNAPHRGMAPRYQGRRP